MGKWFFELSFKSLNEHILQYDFYKEDGIFQRVGTQIFFLRKKGRAPRTCC